MLNIGTRMKQNYEEIAKYKLIRRMPVAIRIDGKAFHTFTKGFGEPFDDLMITAMQNTMLRMCQNIQGCVFGYQQSDEITFLLVDYKGFDQMAWFDNEVQKITSISASMATMYFNQEFARLYREYRKNGQLPNGLIPTGKDERYESAIEKGAMFDSRCFNIPREEATNLIYWRQQDAIRNSVEMVARAYFSHKQLFKKTGTDMKQMLLDQFGVDWESDFSIYKQRGTACFKDENGKWKLDLKMPILKGEERKLVDDLILLDE